MRFASSMMVLWLIVGLVAIGAWGCGRKPTLKNNGGTVFLWKIAESDSYGRPIAADADQNIEELLARSIQGRLAGLRDVRNVEVSPAEGIDDAFQIALPGVFDAEVVASAKQLIASAGELRFAIVAQRHHHAKLVELAEASDVPAKFKFVGPAEQPIGLWVKVGDGVDLTLLPLAIVRDGMTGEAIPEGSVAGAESGTLEILVAVDDNADVSGQDFTVARRDTNLQDNTPGIAFALNEQGARKLAVLTSQHVDADDIRQGFFHHLAILFDGTAVSAPRLQSVISDRGMITGKFTQAEVDQLVAILRAGRLPVQLEPAPVSERQVTKGE